MAFVTPLRYPGGKGRLGVWLSQLLSSNNLDGGTYVEPYAGGAGAAMHLLTTGAVRQIVINDIDPVIFQFWWAVFNRTTALARRIRAAKVTLEERDHQKAILRSNESQDPLDVAFATFFLNRTSRSGILTGGPIGGRLQDGKYRLDARFNRDQLADRVKTLGALKDRVSLTNIDAMDLLSSISRRKKKLLVYCDPPYFNKGYQLYENHYSAGDHSAIAQRMQELKVPWIVTYDDCPQIRSLYESARATTFSLHYSTHLQRNRATELLYYGNLSLNPAPFLHR